MSAAVQISVVVLDTFITLLSMDFYLALLSAPGEGRQRRIGLGEFLGLFLGLVNVQLIMEPSLSTVLRM
jgi:hypothetical protein